jgi:hypothetical protein
VIGVAVLVGEANDVVGITERAVIVQDQDRDRFASARHPHVRPMKNQKVRLLDVAEPRVFEGPARARSNG